MHVFISPVTLTSTSAQAKADILQENVLRKSNANRAKSLLVKFLTTFVVILTALQQRKTFSMNAISQRSPVFFSMHTCSGFSYSDEPPTYENV
jgi:hypothetical protein